MLSVHIIHNNDDDVEEGVSHPTILQTTVTCKLAERLRSAGRDWQRAEGGEGDVDDDVDDEHVDGRVRGLGLADTGNG